MSTREVAILGGGRASVHNDAHGLLRDMARGQYGEDNVHLIEVDWGGAYPAWYQQVEASILRQSGPNPDVIGYSMGGLLALDFSSKHQVGTLALLSASCWHGPKIMEWAQEFGTVLSHEQLEDLGKLDVPRMASDSTASRAHIFYGDQEISILQATGVVIAENMKDASDAADRQVTLTEVQGATHQDALLPQYLSEVRAMLAA